MDNQQSSTLSQNFMSHRPNQEADNNHHTHNKSQFHPDNSQIYSYHDENSNEESIQFYYEQNIYPQYHNQNLNYIFQYEEQTLMNFIQPLKHYYLPKMSFDTWGQLQNLKLYYERLSLDHNKKIKFHENHNDNMNTSVLQDHQKTEKRLQSIELGDVGLENNAFSSAPTPQEGNKLKLSEKVTKVNSNIADFGSDHMQTRNEDNTFMKIEIEEDTENTFPQNMPQKTKELLQKKIAPYFVISKFNETQVSLKMKFPNTQESSKLAKALQTLTSVFNSRQPESEVIGGLFFLPQAYHDQSNRLLIYQSLQEFQNLRFLCLTMVKPANTTNEEIKQLGTIMPLLNQLEVVQALFQEVEISMNEAEVLSFGIGATEGITRLELQFNNCKQFELSHGFGKNLIQNTKLKELSFIIKNIPKESIRMGSVIEILKSKVEILNYELEGIELNSQEIALIGSHIKKNDSLKRLSFDLFMDHAPQEEIDQFYSLILCGKHYSTLSIGRAQMHQVQESLHQYYESHERDEQEFPTVERLDFSKLFISRKESFSDFFNDIEKLKPISLGFEFIITKLAEFNTEQFVSFLELTKPFVDKIKKLHLFTPSSIDFSEASQKILHYLDSFSSLQFLRIFAQQFESSQNMYDAFLKPISTKITNQNSILQHIELCFPRIQIEVQQIQQMHTTCSKQKDLSFFYLITLKNAVLKAGLHNQGLDSLQLDLSSFKIDTQFKKNDDTKSNLEEKSPDINKNQGSKKSQDQKKGCCCNIF